MTFIHLQPFDSWLQSGKVVTVPPAMAKKRRSSAGADPSSTKKSRSIEEFAKDDNGGIFTAAQQCIRQFQEWTSRP